MIKLLSCLIMLSALLGCSDERAEAHQDFDLKLEQEIMANGSKLIYESLRAFRTGTPDNRKEMTEKISREFFSYHLNSCSDKNGKIISDMYLSLSNLRAMLSGKNDSISPEQSAK